MECSWAQRESFAQNPDEMTKVSYTLGQQYGVCEEGGC